jgi:hypothetical protein
MSYTTRVACRLLGRDRKQQADDIATGYCGHVPEAVAGLRYWDRDDLAAERFFIDLRGDGHPVKLAGFIATRLRCAMRVHPDADQLSLVTLENGNRFALPTETVDLTGGWNSGGRVREAVIIDARNLRERIQEAIEADPQLTEVRDEAA